MQIIWAYVSGLYLQNFLSPKEIDLGSKPCKENDHIFSFCFLESGSWVESGDSMKFLVNREAAAWGPRLSEKKNSAVKELV